MPEFYSPETFDAIMDCLETLGPGQVLVYKKSTPQKAFSRLPVGLMEEHNHVQFTKLLKRRVNAGEVMLVQKRIAVRRSFALYDYWAMGISPTVRTLIDNINRTVSEPELVDA